MTAGVVVRCPAKINTDLRVIRRRPDGYHELDTEFVALALHDTLELAPASGFLLEVRGATPDEVPTEDNLVLRAARALAGHAGGDRVPGGRFVLTKRVPAAAGLGGGSSDAAGALVGLDRLHRLGTPPDVLAHLALSIGSDVPFFLRGGRQRGRGRGEILEPLVDLPATAVLLVKPPASLSTRTVFDEHATHSLTRRKTELTFSVEDESIGSEPRNDLLEAASRLAPEVGEAREALKRTLPRARIGLSGSGPTLFALLEPGDDAAVAASRVHEALPAAWICTTRTMGAGELAASRFDGGEA